MSPPPPGFPVRHIAARGELSHEMAVKFHAIVELARLVSSPMYVGWHDFVRGFRKADFVPDWRI